MKLPQHHDEETAPPPNEENPGAVLCVDINGTAPRVTLGVHFGMVQGSSPLLGDRAVHTHLSPSEGGSEGGPPRWGAGRHGFTVEGSKSKYEQLRLWNHFTETNAVNIVTLPFITNLASNAGITTNFYIQALEPSVTPTNLLFQLIFSRGDESVDDKAVATAHEVRIRAHRNRDRNIDAHDEYGRATWMTSLLELSFLRTTRTFPTASWRGQ